MFNPWFISPWQAARISLEAQRGLAFSFLRMVSGDIESRASTPRRIDQSATNIEATIDQSATNIEAKSVPGTRPKTVAARQASGRSSKKRAGVNTNKRSQGKRKHKTS
jgi:hypothetical protein